MDDNVKLAIQIETSASEDRTKVIDVIREQLRENEDYINGNIDLNIDPVGVIMLYVYEGCTSIPTLLI